MATDTQQPGDAATRTDKTALDAEANGTKARKRRRLRFDKTRPTPWKYLITWSALVIVLMLGTQAVSNASKLTWGLVAGAVLAGFMYLALGWLLTKFGWDPTRLALQRRKLRDDRIAAKRSGQDGVDAKTGASTGKPNNRKPANAVQHKVAPTKRTNLTNQRKVKTR
jgi:ABC-type multidrug transport system fused ATPase/permease subunit